MSDEREICICPTCGRSQWKMPFGKPPEALSAPPGDSAKSAALENLREAWAAMAMIREAIETLGPVGAVKASEHLDGPTFMDEAEALVAGIRAIAAAEGRSD